MDPRYPPIEPYATGLLDVGGCHRVYWECCGNPAGQPVLYLHGGPGSGCSPGQRRFFDPVAYRAVLMDQRGCGRSRPLASDADYDLSANTTRHLIADIETLREHLGIDRWVVFGLSWGTTLALAYTRAHRERVQSLVLGLVTTTSRREVRWITEGVGCIFPREWERFRTALPERLRDRPLVDACAEWLGDAAECERAAREWCAWEDTHVSLAPGHRPSPQYESPEFRLRFAKLVTHYWRHAAFLDDGAGDDGPLLRDAASFDGVPGVMIHGRFDVSSPLETAWRLARGWRSCRLQVLEHSGHGDGDDFLPAVIGALNGFARR
jgi:proline iminopeptidase